MKEIITTLGGRTFQVGYPADSISPEHRTGALNKIEEIIQLGTSNCPTAPITVNTAKTLSSGFTAAGTPPYTYLWTVTKPLGGVDTFNVQNPGSYTFSQTGTYGITLAITDSCPDGAKTDSATCSIVVQTAAGICAWIASIGGISGITIPGIFTLVDAYLGIGNIGFTPTITQIMGVVDYYLGFISSGNSKTGCTY